jgi:urease accessory protein UreH
MGGMVASASMLLWSSSPTLGFTAHTQQHQHTCSTLTVKTWLWYIDITLLGFTAHMQQQHKHTGSTIPCRVTHNYL